MEHQRNAYNGISLSKLKRFHSSYLFTDYHSEDEVENFEQLLGSLNHMTSLKMLDLELNRIYHYRGTTSIWGDLYERLGRQIGGDRDDNSCLQNLETLRLRMNAPTLTLLDSMAYAIENNTNYTNLELCLTNMVEYTNATDGCYATIKQVKHFGDALVNASHITSLNVELDVIYFQHIILPAIYASSSNKPLLRKCTNLNFNFVNGGETMGTLSETEITCLFEHFGSIDLLENININLQNLRSHSFRPFAYSLESSLQQRRYVPNVKVECSSDKEALFAELLTNHAVAMPNRQQKTIITYYVTGTRPKRGYTNVLEERLAATGISNYKLNIGNKEDPFTWILVLF